MPVARRAGAADTRCADHRESTRSRRACRRGGAGAGSRRGYARPSASSRARQLGASRRRSAAAEGGQPSGTCSVTVQRCTGARASPDRRAGASRSSRRGHRRRGCVPGISAARRPRARARHAPGSWPARRARRRRDGRRAPTASSKRAVARMPSRYWASASSGQKTMSPCESPARMPRSRSKNVNHCGQSPSGFWAPKTRSEQIAQAAPSAERQQQLDRTLADVARTPAAAGVLLEPRGAR